jgi:hypothetical protein
MKRDDRTTTRRRFLQHAALLAGASALGDAGRLLTGFNAFAQDPPSGCPALPVGGTPFVPGSDTRPIILRKSVSALTPAEITKLRDAYTALRALPASDKRTWVLQADLHALYCSSCTGVPTDIHGSWNFFPWHRAYIYYYERILGSLVGDIDNFRLPYWDWTTLRTLPGTYSSPGNSGNSLWDSLRDPGLAGGGNLPAFDGTAARINDLYLITDFATFGGDGGSGGSMESDPHGPIHIDTGTPAWPRHDMGSLGFAARDPLFFTHHGNIDRIWSKWNALGSSSSSIYKNPTDAAFLNARWSFYDENQQVVSISAADVLDHRTQLRYIYEFRLRVPRIPRMFPWKCRLICCRPGPDPAPFIQIEERARESILSASRAGSPVLLVLRGVQIPREADGIFDIVARIGERNIRVGSIGAFEHMTTHARGRRPVTLTLNITQAVQGLLAKENPATLRVVPRKRGNRPMKAFTLQAKEAEIRTQQR